MGEEGREGGTGHPGVRRPQGNGLQKTELSREDWTPGDIRQRGTDRRAPDFHDGGILRWRGRGQVMESCTTASNAGHTSEAQTKGEEGGPSTVASAPFVMRMKKRLFIFSIFLRSWI